MIITDTLTFHVNHPTEAIELEHRVKTAINVAKQGGDLAVAFFRQVGTLTIEDKGPQDFVSEADKEVEVLILTIPHF